MFDGGCGSSGSFQLQLGKLSVSDSLNSHRQHAVLTNSFAESCCCGHNLVDPASSHMLVSKIKPCMSQYKFLHGETANGSLKQL